MFHLKKVLTMKKNAILFASALMAVLGTSCSQDETLEVNNGRGISFRPFTETTTRAAEVTTANLQSFNVWAFGDGENTAYDFADEYSKTGQTWSFKSGTRYWPGDNTTLRFYAFNKGDFGSGNGTVTETIERGSGSDVNASISYTPATETSKQKDLVVAYASGSNATTSSGTNAVDINFKHALSKIVVKAKNSSDIYRVYVKDVKIANLVGSSTLTMPTDTEDKTTLQRTNLWPSVGSGQANINYFARSSGDGTLLKKTAEVLATTDKGNAFMVIPQKQDAWDGKSKDNGATAATGAYFSILCRIEQYKGSGDKGSDDSWTQIFPRKNQDDVTGTAHIGKFAYSAVGVPTDWEPGKQYTYTLEFFGQNGGAGVTDPEEKPDPSNPDVDPEDPSVPIVGGELKLNVTVSAWNKDTYTDVEMGK